MSMERHQKMDLARTRQHAVGAQLPLAGGSSNRLTANMGTINSSAEPMNLL